MKLQHRHFVIGITGGIAAYKTCELIRRLQDEGATVQVVMTESGTRFVSQLTFQALSGRPVYCSAWETPAQSGPANAMPHIDLTRECDAILVAPASADFIARIANGQANDLLTTLCLAREVPLFIAPAMNRQMWQNAATQRNIEQLRHDSIRLLGPDTGSQACGEIGDGRMLEPQSLLADSLLSLAPTPSIRLPQTLQISVAYSRGSNSSLRPGQHLNPSTRFVALPIVPQEKWASPLHRRPPMQAQPLP